MAGIMGMGNAGMGWGNWGQGPGQVPSQSPFGQQPNNGGITGMPGIAYPGGSPGFNEAGNPLPSAGANGIPIPPNPNQQQFGLPSAGTISPDQLAQQQAEYQRFLAANAGKQPPGPGHWWTPPGSGSGIAGGSPVGGGTGMPSQPLPIGNSPFERALGLPGMGAPATGSPLGMGNVHPMIQALLQHPLIQNLMQQWSGGMQPKPMQVGGGGDGQNFIPSFFNQNYLQQLQQQNPTSGPVTGLGPRGMQTLGGLARFGGGGV